MTHTFLGISTQINLTIRKHFFVKNVPKTITTIKRATHYCSLFNFFKKENKSDKLGPRESNLKIFGRKWGFFKKW